MILVLFFTRGVSLETWIKTGLFEREKLIYEEHLKRNFFKKIYWITYGINDRTHEETLKQAKKLNQNIEIIPMRRIFNSRIGIIVYSILVPVIHRKILRYGDIIKTNQMDGSWSAVISKLFFKKPLIVRTGYTISLFIKKQTNSKPKKVIYEIIERIAYKFCDYGIVASNGDKKYICDKYNIDEKKIYVIHNYIDIARFRPMKVKKYNKKIIFVGRLTEQKNLFNLISAVSKTKYVLDIYGDGELKEHVKEFARDKAKNVRFMGVVANEELPSILNRYKYFILPSLYEGMPKTLLEAMSCGLLCIGTNVEGIDEVIQDGFNGILTKDTTIDGIFGAIVNVQYSDYKYISRNAVITIHDRFSLSNMARREEDVFKKVI